MTDRPEWLKPGVRASFAYKAASTNRDFFGCEVVHRGILSEVSVPSPDREPAEPGARVLTCRPTETPKPKPTMIRRSLPSAARRITPDEELEEYLRRVDWYGSDVPAELIIQNMKRELQAIRRCG